MGPNWRPLKQAPSGPLLRPFWILCGAFLEAMCLRPAIFFSEQISKPKGQKSKKNSRKIFKMKKTNKNNKLGNLREDLRVEGLKIRAQCAVGDIVVVHPTYFNTFDRTHRLAIITHIPEDVSVNACKTVWLDDLGQAPISVLFNDIKKFTEELF